MRRTVVLGMPMLSSFHSSGADRQQISAIVREYFALERVRIYRRLFVVRFGLLAVAFGVAGIGFHWLSPVATWASVAICLAAPLSAWIAELRYDRRLARLLEEVTGNTRSPLSA